MTKIISLFNQKGGVGKTTTTINLGAALAARKKKVLLIDIDAQCNLTQSLGYDDEEEALNIYGAIKGKYPLPILKKKENLDVVIGTLDLAAADLELSGEAGRDFLLKDCIKPIKDNYDYILIDCPPALNVLTLNALTVSDGVIIPVQSEFLALHGMKKLLETIDKVQSRTNSVLTITGILLTQYDSRNALCKMVEKTVRNNFEGQVFRTVIRRNVSLAEAPSQGIDIFDYEPKSNGACDYDNLANEIIK